MVSFESYFINLLILLKSAALIFKATIMQKYFHEFDFSKKIDNVCDDYVTAAYDPFSPISKNE